MSILCVGSVALDSVETPFGKAERVVGGSAVYHRLWTAPHPEGPVLALRTRVIWT